MKQQAKILFIGDTSHWSALAAQLIGATFAETQSIFWDFGTPKPQDIKDWVGDWIICFKADLILETSILQRAKRGALNIHPATPTYRGIGGYYYALDNMDREFGVTCHHIVRDIDAGPIIDVRRFPIIPGETPEMLKLRTGAYCMALLGEAISRIVSKVDHPVSAEQWSSHLYTRAQLDEYLRAKSTQSAQIARIA